jgi:hypothetical protein
MDRKKKGKGSGRNKKLNLEANVSNPQNTIRPPNKQDER